MQPSAFFFMRLFCYSPIFAWKREILVSRLEVTTRFELVNDGFAGRSPTIQKPLFFLGFLRVDSQITIAVTIAVTITVTIAISISRLV